MAATITATTDQNSGRVLLLWDGATVGDRILRDGVPIRYQPVTSPTGVVYDYEARPGQTHTWTLSGASTTATMDTGKCNGAFLVHPTDPGLTQKVKVRDDNPNQWDAPGTVHQVMGVRSPVVTHTARSLHTGTLVFWTPYAQRQAIIDLFADGTPILLNPPTCCPLEYEWTWGSLQADKIDVTGTSGIWWTYEYQRIARPAGDVTGAGAAANTWKGVYTEPSHQTWADLVTAHATWADVSATLHPHGQVTP